MSTTPTHSISTGATTTTQFPDGYFFVKNQSNGLVLSVEKDSTEAGGFVIVESLKTKGYDSQLWTFENGLLKNKRSKLSLGVEKGSIKINTETIQSAKEGDVQEWALGEEGHIYVKSKPAFVIGIKDSFFSKKEGSRLHIQERKKNTHKEQRWDFVIPKVKAKVVTEEPKPALSPSSLEAEEGKWPEGWFFIKNQETDQYLSIEGHVEAGTRVYLERFNKKDHASQLWKWDNGFVINKRSGHVLDINRNHLRAGTDIVQFTAKSLEEASNQQWGLNIRGNIYLKVKRNLVLNVHDGYFSSPRAVISEVTKEKRQKWTFVLPVYKKKTVRVWRIGYAQFPTGLFFLKYSKELVLDVETKDAESKVILRKLDISGGGYKSQLWRFKDGYLVNESTGYVISAKDLADGSKNYQVSGEGTKFKLLGDGTIVAELDENLVFSADDDADVGAHTGLRHKDKINETIRRWNFFIPVFGKRKTQAGVEEDVVESTDEVKDLPVIAAPAVEAAAQEADQGEEEEDVMDDDFANAASVTIETPQDANVIKFGKFPAREFFLKWRQSDLVVDFDPDTNKIVLNKLNLASYKYQLWTYEDGHIVNWTSKFVLDIEKDEISSGMTLYQKAHNAESETQRWAITLDGAIFSGANPDLHFGAKDGDNLFVHSKDELVIEKNQRWSFLIPVYSTINVDQVEPEIDGVEEQYNTIENGVITAHKQIITTVYKYDVISFPDKPFFLKWISFGKDLVLTVEESSRERNARIILQALNLKSYKCQLWTFKNGFLVNAHSGHVLNVKDSKLAPGSLLTQVEEKSGSEATCQHWGYTSDGIVFIQGMENLVLIGAEKDYLVQLANASEGRSRIKQSWSLIIPNFKRTRSTITFPQEKYMTAEYWFFIRWGADLVWDVKDGKAVFGKQRTNDFDTQLWAYRDGYLINKATGYVLAVEGNDASTARIVLVPKVDGAKNQHWLFDEEGCYYYSTIFTNLAIGAPKENAEEGTLLALVDRKLIMLIRTIFLRYDTGSHSGHHEDGSEIDSVHILSDSASDASFPVSPQDIRQKDLPIPTTPGGTTSVPAVEKVPNPPGVIIKEQPESQEPQSDTGIYGEEQDEPDETIKKEEAAPVEMIEKDIEPVNPKAAAEAAAAAAALAALAKAESENKTHKVTDQPVKAANPMALVPVVEEKESKPILQATDTLTRPRDELQESAITRYKPLEHSGHFPEQEFFIKNNLQGYALEALDDGTVVLRKIRSTDFLAQLWIYRNGWLINQKTHQALDIPGHIESGKDLCMTVTPRSDHNWATENVGFIFWQQKHNLVLGIRPHHQVKDEVVPVFLTDRKHLDHRDEHQQLRWTFLIPVYDKKKVPKGTAAVATDKGEPSITKGVEAVAIAAATVLADEPGKKKDAAPGTASEASSKPLPTAPTTGVGSKPIGSETVASVVVEQPVKDNDSKHPLAEAVTVGVITLGTGEVINRLAEPVKVNANEIKEVTVNINGKPVQRLTWWDRVVDATKDGAHYVVTGVENLVGPAVDGTTTLVKDAGNVTKGAGNLAKDAAVATAVGVGVLGLGVVRKADGWLRRKPGPKGEIIEEEVKTEEITEKIYTGPDGTHWMVAKDKIVDEKDIVEKEVIGPDGKKTKRFVWFGKIVDATKNGGKYVIHGIGDAVEMSEDGLKVVAKDAGNVVKDVVIGTAVVGGALGLGAYELVRAGTGWIRRKRGPKGEIIEEEVKKEEIIEKDTTYKAPDGDVYTAVDKTVKEEDIKEEIVVVDGKPVKRLTWFGRLVDATKNGANYTIHGVGDVVHDAADGTKKVARGVGDVAKDVGIGAAVGIGALGLGAYEFARGVDGWFKRKPSPDGKTIVEEKVDHKDVVASPSGGKYISPDGSHYTVENKIVPEKELVEETVIINGKPVRRWTWLGRLVDATKDGANFVVHGVGDMLGSAADGTRVVIQDAGTVAKGTGNLAKDVAIGTAVGAGALGLGAYELVRGGAGLFRRKPSPDGKTIIEEKVDVVQVAKDTPDAKYYGPDGEEYTITNKDVPVTEIVEDTVIVAGKPVKRLTWLGKVVDATKEGGKYVVHGVGDAVHTTEDGVKTVAKDAGKVAKDVAIGTAVGVGALGLGAYELIRGPKGGWLRRERKPNGEIIEKEVKSEEITEAVYTGPDGTRWMVTKDQVVDEKDIVEKEVIGPDGKKSKRFVWFGKLVDATKEGGKYVVHGVGDAVQKTEDGVKVVAKDTGNVVKDVAIGTALVGGALGLGAYELVRAGTGWIRRKRGPKGEIIEEEVKKEEVIEKDTTYKAPDGDVYTTVDKTVKEEDIKEEIVVVDGKPVKRLTWFGRLVDATKNGANYTIHGVGDVVQVAADGTKKVARGVGDVAKDVGIGAAVGIGALGLGAYELARGVDGWFRRKPSPDGKTIVEEKVDHKDVVATPGSKYISPDGSHYTVENKTVPEKELVEETVIINGKPVRRWTWLGRLADVTKDGANFMVHGVGDMLGSAADGTRVVIQDAGTVAKGTGNLAKDVAIGTAVGAGALGLGAYELVRGGAGLFRRKPSPDGKTIIEEKVDVVQVAKDTPDAKYYGPDGEEYAITNKEVPAKDVVEDTVIVAGKPVKRLTWLGHVVDATKNGANYVVHGVGDAVHTTEDGVKTAGKAAIGLGTVGYEIIRGPKGWLRKERGPKGEIIEKEVKSEEITEKVYTGPDGTHWIVAKDQVVDEKDIIETEVVGPDGKKSKRFLWFGKLVDATKEGGKYVVHGIGDAVQKTEDGVKVVAKDTGNVIKDVAIGTALVGGALGLGAYELVRTGAGWVRRKRGPKGEIIEEEVKKEEIIEKDTTYKAPDGDVYTTVDKTVKEEDIKEEIVVVDGKPVKRLTWFGRLVDATKNGANYTIHGVGDVVHEAADGTKKAARGVGDMAKDVIKDVALTTALGVGGAAAVIRSPSGWFTRKPSPDGQSVIEVKVEPKDVKQTQYLGPDGEVYSSPKEPVDHSKVIEETVIIDGKPQRRPTLFGRVVDATKDGANYVVHGVGDAITTTENGVKTVAKDTGKVAKDVAIGTALGVGALGLGAYELVRGPKGWLRREQKPNGEIIEKEVKSEEITDKVYTGPDGTKWVVTKDQIVDEKDIIEKDVVGPDGKKSKRFVWFGKLVDATKEGGKYVVHGVGEAVQKTEDGVKVVAKDTGNVVKDVAIGTALVGGALGLGAYELVRTGAGWVRRKRGPKGEIIEEEVKKEEVIEKDTTYKAPDGDVYTTVDKTVKEEDIKEEIVVVDGKPVKRLTWLGRVVDATKNGANYTIHGVGDVVHDAADGTKKVARGVGDVAKDVAIGAAVGVGAVGLGAYELFRGAEGLFRHKPSPDGKTIVEEKVKPEDVKDAKYYGPDGEVYTATKQIAPPNEVIEETVIVDGKPKRRYNWYGKVVDATKEGGNYVIHGVGEAVTTTENGVRTVAKDTGSLVKDVALGAGALGLGAYGLVRSGLGWSRLKPTADGKVVEEEVKTEEIKVKDTEYRGPDGEIYKTTQEEVKSEDVIEETVVINGKPQRRYTWFGKVLDATKDGGKYIVHGVGDAVTTTENGVKVVAKDTGKVAKDVAIGAALGVGALGLGAYELVRGAEGMIRRKPSPDGKTVIEEKVKIEEVKDTKYHGPDGDVYVVANKKVPVTEIKEDIVVIDGKPQKRTTWLGNIVDATKDGGNYVIHGVGDVVLATGSGVKTVAKDTGNVAKGAGNIVKDVVVGTALGIGALGLGAYDLVRSKTGGWYRLKPTPDGKVVEEEVKEVDVKVKDVEYRGPDGEVYKAKQEEVKAEDVVEETVIVNGKPQRRLTWLGKIVDATKVGGNYIIHGVGDVITTTENGVKVVATDAGKLAKGVAIGTAVGAGAIGLGTYELLRGTAGWVRRKLGPDGKTVVEEEVKPEDVKNAKYYGPDGDVYAAAKREVPATEIKEETVVVDGKPQKRLIWLGNVVDATKNGSNYVIHGVGDAIRSTESGVKAAANNAGNVAKGAVIGAAVGVDAVVRGNKGFVRRKPTADGLVIEEEVKVDEIKDTAYYGPDGGLYKTKEKEVEVKVEDIKEETVIIDGKPTRRLTWLGKIVDATKEGGNYVIHGVGDAVETAADGTRVVARSAGNLVKDLAIGTAIGVGMAGIGAYGLVRGIGGSFHRSKPNPDGKIVEEEVKKEDIIVNTTEPVRYYGPDGDVYAVTHQDAPAHEIVEETVIIDGKPQKRLTWYGKLVDATKEGGNYVIHGVGDAISTTEDGVKTVAKTTGNAAKDIAIGTAVGLGALGLGAYEIIRGAGGWIRRKPGPNGEVIEESISKDEKVTKTVYSTPDGSKWVASVQEVDEKDVVEKEVILPDGTKAKRFVWFGKVVDATKEGGKYVIHGIGDTVVATENGVKVVGKDAGNLAKSTAGGVIAGATGLVRGISGWLRPTTTPGGEVVHEEVKKEEVIEKDTTYKAPDGDVYTVVDKKVKEEDIKEEIVLVDGKPVKRLTWLGRLVDASKQGGEYVVHGVGDAIHETADGTKTVVREVGDVAKDVAIGAAVAIGALGVGAYELVRGVGGWYHSKPTPDGKRELVKVNVEEVTNKGPENNKYYGPDGGVYAVHNQPVKANEIIEEEIIVNGKPQKQKTWLGRVVDATKDGADYVVHGVGDVVHTTADGTKVVAKDAGNLAKDVVVGTVIGAGALGLGGYELIRTAGGWAKRKPKPDGKMEVVEVKDYTNPDGEVFVAYKETVPENQIKEEEVLIDGKPVKRKTWLGRIVDASKDGANYVIHGVGDVIDTTENGVKKVGRDVTTVAKDAALLGAGVAIAGGVGAYEIVRGLGGWFRRRNGPNGEVIVEEIKDEKIITDAKEYRNPDGETYEVINREVDDKDIIVEEVIGADGKPAKQKTWLGNVVDATKVGGNWIVHGAKKTPVWAAGAGGMAGKASSLDTLRASGRLPSKPIVSPTESQTTSTDKPAGGWGSSLGKTLFALGSYGIPKASTSTPSTSKPVKEDPVYALSEESDASRPYLGTEKETLGPLVAAKLTENLPAHFGHVKAYLFDVFTLVDWKASIAAEVEALAKSVNVTTSHDWQAFAVKWKAGFDTEVNRIVSLKKDSADYQKSDIILRAILDKLLVEYGLNGVLKEQQIAHLNLVWHRLNLHDDTQKSVQRIKEKYIAATFSNLSFRTLVDLARHCSICWNANISTELFDNYKPDPAAYELAADILSLNPNQIAIVSYDLVDLQAAKKAGFATILTSRQTEIEKVKVTVEVDVVVQNLDGLVTIHEKGFAEEIVTEGHERSKSWFQSVVDTTKHVASATIGTITDIGEDVVELATGRGHEETEK